MLNHYTRCTELLQLETLMTRKTGEIRVVSGKQRALDEFHAALNTQSIIANA